MPVHMPKIVSAGLNSFRRTNCQVRRLHDDDDDLEHAEDTDVDCIRDR